MGRKRNAKSRARAFAEKKKHIPADEYFRRGPFEVAQFGKFVLAKNTLTKEQHEKYLQALAGHLPQVVTSIDAEIAGIVAIVEQHSALGLLQRAYMENACAFLLQEDGDPQPRLEAELRMVDYVQSVIAAVKPAPPDAPAPNDAAWRRLRGHIETLFHMINFDYIQARTADWHVNGGKIPEDHEEFYVRALLAWCNVTGHRYHHQEIPYLRSLLAPHDAVLQRLWGIDANALIEGLGRILHALSRGLGESYEYVFESYQKYIGILDEGGPDQEARLEALKAQIHEDPAARAVGDKLTGFGIFRIDGFLPPKLLDDLSWQPGECPDFIDRQPQSGWPTRVWPRSRRPFLHIEDSYYCFDVHALFDHFYRVLQRLIADREPNYRQNWNDAQKAVSEALPLDLLQRILPGARVCREVFYQNDDVDTRGNRKWCELDGLVCFDDHLFIVEVKAGAFSAAPPETDFARYVQSIEKLIFEPAQQGERFLRWLDGQGKIELFDKGHRKVGDLDRQQFEHLTICAISLDPFTEIAAKCVHLQPLVSKGVATPFWSLNIGDLITYSELIENPLVFLHFVERRARAVRSKAVQLDDEFDHYGMYLKHNDYGRYAEGVGKGSRMSWHGYRTAIDQYFNDRERGVEAVPPRREMPALFERMIRLLAQSGSPNRRKLASELLDLADVARKGIAAGLEEGIREVIVQRTSRPRSFKEDGVHLTFSISQTGGAGPSHADAIQHCQAAMLVGNEQERMLVEISVGPDGRMFAVEPTVVRATDLDPAARQSLEAESQTLKVRRLERAMTPRGKVGPNEPCPCESGKKYKKCCRP